MGTTDSDGMCEATCASYTCTTAGWGKKSGTGSLKMGKCASYTCEAMCCEAGIYVWKEVSKLNAAGREMYGNPNSGEQVTATQWQVMSMSVFGDYVRDGIIEAVSWTLASGKQCDKHKLSPMTAYKSVADA